MTRETNYRSALSKETIIERLKKAAGTQFDPELVMIFIEKIL
jgi:HD-GYP domain